MNSRMKGFGRGLFLAFALISPQGLSAGQAASEQEPLENEYVPAERIPFAFEAPGQPQQLGPLWGRRAAGPAGTLLKVPAGFRAPIHAHTADYRAVVITGVWTHWVPETNEGQGLELRPGAYWTQKADQMHGDACVSDTECVILLINEDPYETYLPE